MQLVTLPVHAGAVAAGLARPRPDAVTLVATPQPPVLAGDHDRLHGGYNVINDHVEHEQRAG